MTTATAIGAEIREATVPDMTAMASLIEELHRHESELGDNGVTSDKGARRKAVNEHLANAMFDHDSHILVIEKSGALVGIFVLEVEERSALYKKRRVCNVWVGFAMKNPIYIKKILRLITEWAREHRCESVVAHVMNKNERMQKLMVKIGFTESMKVYVKGV